MGKGYILVSLEDEVSKHLAEVLGNKTCKKIIDFLAQNDKSSEKDIADALGIPINTIEYNLKKLEKVGIIKKSEKFFWSKKGKKIPTYTLSNKTIVISPTRNVSSKIKSILPVVLISGFFVFLVKQIIMLKNKSKVSDFYNRGMIASESASANTLIAKSNLLFTNYSCVWIWFLFGVVMAIIIFTIINWGRL